MIFGVILDIIAASFIEFPVSSEVCFIFRIFNVVHVFPDFLLCTCYIPDTCLTDITVKLTVDKPAVIIRTSYVEKPVTIACTGKTFLFAVGKFYFGEFAVAIVSASALFFSIDVENNCFGGNVDVGSLHRLPGNRNIARCPSDWKCLYWLRRNWIYG